MSSESKRAIHRKGGREGSNRASSSASASPVKDERPPARNDSSSAVSLELMISGSEQVFVDPNNRDAVIRPRRGSDQSTENLAMCTAFVVEVYRNGLRYSIPVRYSRFERLQSELAQEFPTLRLPALPAKRGPLDPQKLSALLSHAFRSLEGSARDSSRHGAPVDDPVAIEERTRALDQYLRALVELPGVASSAALMDLVALSGPAEAAVRQALEAAASHDEARASALGELSKELAVSGAYVRKAGAARERADARAIVLGNALEAAVGLMAQRRDDASLAGAWRMWQALCRCAARRRHAELLTRAQAALREEQERNGQLEAEAVLLQTQLAEARSAHVAAAVVATEAESAFARADAAAKTAAAARAEARAASQYAASQSAAAASLSRSLEDADVELRRAWECVATREAGTAALHREIRLQRQRRTALALRCALEQRANEARLLFLVQSQREALDRSALELAAVRRAVAVEREEPKLEAAWLAQPAPPLMPPAADASSPAATEPDADEDAQRDAAAARWRREWLAAMAHTL